MHAAVYHGSSFKSNFLRDTRAQTAPHLSHDVHKPSRLDIAHPKGILRSAEILTRMPSRQGNVPVGRDLVQAKPAASPVANREWPVGDDDDDWRRVDRRLVIG